MYLSMGQSQSAKHHYPDVLTMYVQYLLGNVIKTKQQDALSRTISIQCIKYFSNIDLHETQFTCYIQYILHA